MPLPACAVLRVARCRQYPLRRAYTPLGPAGDPAACVLSHTGCPEEGGGHRSFSRKLLRQQDAAHTGPADFRRAGTKLCDRNEAVHGIDTLTFGLQLLFVLQDVPTLWRTGIDIVRRQPPEPQRDFAPIVPFVAGISHSEIHSEMIPFRFRGVRIVVEVYDKNAGSTNQFSNNRSLPYSICNNLFEVSAPPARFTS